MDPIKDAFTKVKEDIEQIRQELEEIKKSLIELCDIVPKLLENSKRLEGRQKPEPPIPQEVQPRPIILQPFPDQDKPDKLTIQDKPDRQAFSTQMPENQTNQQIPLVNNPLYYPKTPSKYQFSTGNRGVPADRQTDQQTDRQSNFPSKSPSQSPNNITRAAQILESFDTMKREIKDSFRKLTEQEWLIFSTIYQLDEEKGFSDYKILAGKLGLTESSIRDYVARLIKKGIPVDKTKINNKTIHLNVSKNLKQIASLPTLLQLRGF